MNWSIMLIGERYGYETAGRGAAVKLTRLSDWTDVFLQDECASALVDELDRVTTSAELDRLIAPYFEEDE